jgi:tetratricopeptide (TPR) repeat protein
MKILRTDLLTISLLLFGLAVSGFAQVKADDRAVLAAYEKSIDSGNLSAVERDLFNYVIAHPSDGSGFALLAKLRLKQNRPSEAKALAGKALTIEPNLLSAKLTLALALSQLGEVEQAREILAGVSEKDIADNAARLNLVENLVRLGECPRALGVADKLPLKIKNGEALPLRAVCYLSAGDRQNLAALIPQARVAVRQNPPAAVGFAEVLLKGGILKEAVEVLRLALIAAPKNVEALLLLARAEIFSKDFPNAKIHLAQAEKLTPDSGELFFIKSLLENEQGNLAASYELLEKSLGLNSDNAQVLAQYIAMALRVGQPARAVRAAEKLLSLAPDNPENSYLYGLALLQNNNPTKAEPLLIKYFSDKPKDSRGCLALGLTFAGQPDKLELARRQMQKCLEIDPNNFEAAYQLGLSYKTLGESAKAIEYFERTVKLSPNYPAALRELGAAYLQTGAEAKARPPLEKAVKLAPDDPDAHFQLSRLYNVLGERELGKKHLEIFQKLKNPKKDGM